MSSGHKRGSQVTEMLRGKDDWVPPNMSVPRLELDARGCPKESGIGRGYVENSPKNMVLGHMPTIFKEVFLVQLHMAHE